MVGIVVAGIVLLAVVGFFFWRAMEGPLYTPGMVRSGQNLRSPLAPPEQTGGGSYWQVEADVRLFHHAQGSGRPVLVVHGGPGYPIRGPLAGLEPLVNDFRFCYYDQRGCGKSTRPFDRFESSNFYTNMQQLEQTLGIGAQIADIERIRRILGQEKLILIGHSFGAFLAAMYAAEFPEHVEALVLVAPAGVLVVPDETGKDLFEEIRGRLPEEKQAEYDHFLRGYFAFGSIFKKSEAELAAMNRQIGQYFLEASDGDDAVNEDDPPADNGGWMVQAMYFSLGKRHDYREALRRVQSPALIIHGEQDLVPQRISRMYADCLPTSQLLVVKSSQPRGGHFPLRDEPEMLAAALAEFLAEWR